jgi:beta-lactamase regulating signal transducer with metallopeptidase domain
MPSNFDLLSFQIARLALAYLLHSTLLLGGTWLFLRAARIRSWALRERVWKLAMILPVITAAIPVPASWTRPAPQLNFEQIVPGLRISDSGVAHVEGHETEPIVAADVASDRSEAINAVRSCRSEEPIPVALNEPPSAVTLSAELPTPDTKIAETGFAAVRESGGVRVVLGISYSVLAFFIVGTLHVIRRSLVFARSLRNCRPLLDESIQNVLANLLRKANVRRRVRLLQSASDRPPAAFGLVRWTIVLPQALIPTLKPDELRALLGHELAHLARGDALWLWIGRILCACFAFQPLNFLARAQLRLAAEFLCDEWAVRHSANRFALARCLTRVAEWSAHLSSPPLELAAVGPRTNLSERVERLILERCPSDSWDNNRRRWLVWATAFAAAFAVECSAPRTSLLAEPPTPSADADLPVTKSNGGTDADPLLTDALQSLSEETSKLFSELQRVNAILKESPPPDPAIKAIAVRLDSRAAKLANAQAHLARFQAPTTSPQSASRIEE